MFFFGKKKQKTFLHGAAAERLSEAPSGKVFLLLFLQKKKILGYRARRASAAVSVFSSRQAIVMGPTPPGTGVIAPAWAATSL